MRPEHLVGKRKRSYQSKVRNSESLRGGTPAPAPLGSTLPQWHKRASWSAWGISFPWTQLWWTSPFPASTLWFWPCWGGSRLPSRLHGGRRLFPLAGTPNLNPDLSRNGLIWCKALTYRNEITELVLGQVLRLPSGKLSVSWATAIPELAEALQPCPMLQTNHLPAERPCRAPLCHLSFKMAF